MKELQINPIFRDKIPPLSKEEFEQLEENIVSDGIVREPLVVWNGTIIDGHHRYAIIKKHPEIPYTAREMDFADEWAAISWMCANQLGRRNITDEQKTYLLGKRSEAEKNTRGGDHGRERNGDGTFAPKDQNEPLGKYHSTAQRIAVEHGVGEATVKRAEHFAKGLDAAEEVSEGFRDGVLSGKVKVAKSDVASIRKMTPEQAKRAVEEIKSTGKITKEYKTAREQCDEFNANFPKEEVVEKTVDMFESELLANINAFIPMLKNSLARNSVFLQGDAGKEVANKAFETLVEEIDKIWRLFK